MNIKEIAKGNESVDAQTSNNKKFSKEDYEYYMALKGTMMAAEEVIVQLELEKFNAVEELKRTKDEFHRFIDQCYAKYDLPRNQKFTVDEDTLEIINK